MALIFPDMVAETSVTTGTNDFELAGAVSGFRGFSDVLSDGDAVHYAASFDGEFETGLGFYDSATGRLQREAVFQSSNNNNKVSFSAGTKKVIAAPVGRQVAPVYSARSADYTVVLADYCGVIAMDASGAARTVTLPAAADAGAGFRIVVKKTDSSTNTVTIDGDGSETIDGVTTRVLHLAHQSVALISDGAGWQVMSEGSLFESGDNANGNYVRYADGTQICWAMKQLTYASAGSLLLTWTHPAAFVSAMNSVITREAAISADARINRAIPAATNAVFRLLAASGDAFSSGDVANCNLITIGRWY